MTARERRTGKDAIEQKAKIYEEESNKMDVHGPVRSDVLQQHLHDSIRRRGGGSSRNITDDQL